jgi:hypothetical protein
LVNWIDVYSWLILITTKYGHNYYMECILDYRYVNKKEKCPYCMEQLELVKIDSEMTDTTTLFIID